MNAAAKTLIDSKKAILAAVILSALGAMFYNLLPLFQGVAQDYLGLNNRNTGLLSSVFFAGFTLTTSTAFFWIRRVSWKLTSTLALIMACGSLLLAGFSQNPGLLFLCLFVAGGSFSTVYGIGTTILGDTSNPARWYGLKISAEAMLGAVLLLLLPSTLITSHGFSGLMMGMVLTVLLLVPALIWLPVSAHMPHGKAGAVTPPSQSHLRVWAALSAVMGYLFSATMIWAFLERIASASGISFLAVGNILSATLWFAVLGSLAAVAVGSRFGSWRPFAAASLMFLISLALLASSATLLIYTCGACLFTFAVGMGISYVLTIVANVDMDGRHVVLTVPVIGIGVMVAPVIGGLLSFNQEFDAVLMVGGLSVVFSLIASYFALRT